MLSMLRKVGEVVKLSSQDLLTAPLDVSIKVLEIRGSKVRLGIGAIREVVITTESGIPFSEISKSKG